MTNNKDYQKIMDNYLKHEEIRKAMDIPPLPLNPEQTETVSHLLQFPPSGQENFLLDLFKNRIPPGVDDAAKVKADFLGEILKGEVESPLVSKKIAIETLGTMLGGYNVKYLIDALDDSDLSRLAVAALSKIILIYDAFANIQSLSKTNRYAGEVIESWAKAEWFTNKPKIEEEIKVRIYKVDGEINTDDLSPAGDAPTRPDIPLHALSMGKTRFPQGLKTITQWRKEGYTVAFAGDVVGTGSSRKSATNSLLWHIGEDIPYVPNKRSRGIVIGGVIAPIFFNTVQDSGGLPLIADVGALNNGDIVTIYPRAGIIKDQSKKILTKFKITPNTLLDNFQAGGRISKIIGQSLTKKAGETLNINTEHLFTIPEAPHPSAHQVYTQAQKILGTACGLPGVLPGGTYNPAMTTVLSQDTTGPMTADELKELACLKFLSPLFMQSFCHTAAYPTPTDVKMHKTLPPFITRLKGLALKPGDGVCHSWINRMIIPDTAGTGGDSHTRFPLGISFPAGSGLVAFAGTLGFMPLDVPPSVLVRFSGKPRPGITLRDMVNAIPFFAIKQGLLTVPKKNKKNIFNGRILEIEGLNNISVEEAFELTDSTAERSAAAGCIKLSKDKVIPFVKSNIALLKNMINNGYQDTAAIQNRIQSLEKWLENPRLLSADKGAQYEAIIKIDLSDITEPILACPNDPDDVKLLSEISDTSIDEVFIGSCMTNISHFRAAAKIWQNQKPLSSMRTYICPPTRMDQDQLKEEGYFSLFKQINARIEIPGCSLCMGNQLRVLDNSTVFSTSTRNFDNRMGTGAQVYLGSAELGAIVALKGQLPTPEEYFSHFKEKIEPHHEDVYKYMQFDQTK